MWSAAPPERSDNRSEIRSEVRWDLREERFAGFFFLEGFFLRATDDSSLRATDASPGNVVLFSSPSCAMQPDPLGRSVFPVAVSYAVQGFDFIEFGIDRLEFSAQAFDVAVDGAVVDIDILAVGCIHQLVA